MDTEFAHTYGYQDLYEYDYLTLKELEKELEQAALDDVESQSEANIKLIDEKIRSLEDTKGDELRAIAEKELNDAYVSAGDPWSELEIFRLAMQDALRRAAYPYN